MMDKIMIGIDRYFFKEVLIAVFEDEFLKILDFYNGNNNWKLKCNVK